MSAMKSATSTILQNTPVDAEIELALSGSLGFGGHNVCLAFAPVKD